MGSLFVALYTIMPRKAGHNSQTNILFINKNK